MSKLKRDQLLRVKLSKYYTDFTRFAVNVEEGVVKMKLTTGLREGYEFGFKSYPHLCFIGFGVLWLASKLKVVKRKIYYRNRRGIRRACEC